MTLNLTNQSGGRAARTAAAVVATCITATAAGCGGRSGSDGPDAAVRSPSCEGDAILAPPETWTWVPFPETRCGYGTSAGIGINPTAKSDAVLIYLMSGGACFTAQECAPGCTFGVQHCAAYLGGYDKKNLVMDLSFFKAGSIFDRSSPANPFRDHSFVLVPYCTGDFHAGNQVGPDGIAHVGFTNITAYLARIVPTFCEASRVVLAGSSAGGFGALFNYHQVKAAFGPARVDLVDDAGPPLPPAYMPLQAAMREVWGAAATAPKECTECTESWTAFFPYLSTTYPDATFSLVSSLADPTIGLFFGGPIAQPLQIETAMNKLADTVIDPLPNAQVFYVDELRHVYLSEPLEKESVGVTLGEFLAAQIGDDPRWKSVRP